MVLPRWTEGSRNVDVLPDLVADGLSPVSTHPSTEHASEPRPGCRSPADRLGGPWASGHISPRGIVDLRGPAGRDVRLSYPCDAAVVVAGLPGSGKSTLLRAWSPTATVVDPRVTRTACEARMPTWLPYSAYRPWARLEHMHRTRGELRGHHRPVLIHDCGSRGWMRRWLAHTARRAGRPLHMVMLDVGPEEALSGQYARRRLASRRVFHLHQRGLTRLLSRVERQGLSRLPGVTSLVLLDRGQRDRVTEIRFGLPHG
ncbi:AAA family ATPase [Streptomyces sp. NPDC046557]|uniref:AAA family ATPase n=1 Tax=Streptomyces sp. NPDC046557 TaxID=3155372 RepID=UPI0033D17893